MSSPQTDLPQPKNRKTLPLLILVIAIGLVTIAAYDYFSGGKLGATVLLQSLLAKPMTAEQTAKVQELESKLQQLKETREEIATKIGKLPSDSDAKSDKPESSMDATQATDSKAETTNQSESVTTPTSDEINPANNTNKNSEAPPSEKQP